MEIPCQDVESWLGPVGVAPGRDIEACPVSRQFNLRGPTRRHLVPDREGLWRHGSPDTGRQSQHFRSQSDTCRHNSYDLQYSRIESYPYPCPHPHIESYPTTHARNGEPFLCQPLPDLQSTPYPARARGLLVAMASGTGDQSHIESYPSAHASGASPGEPFLRGRG